MHPSTIFKGTILLIFLCCHPHITTATNNIGDKIIGSGILHSIAHSANNAAYPFYKFFVEGGTGIVSRYFTLNDYWGIGKTIRKVLGHIATKAGTATLAVGTAIKKSAKKRLEEQMEEMNRWWIRQKLATINSIGAGIGAGVGAVVAGSLTDKVIDKIDDKKTPTHSSNGDSGSSSSGDSGSSSSGDSGSSISSSDNSGTTTTTEEEDDSITVAISDPFYAKPWKLGDLWGSWSDPHLVVGSSAGNGESQVIIGQPVEKPSGNADTSSTVAVWGNNPFNFLFGGSGSGGSGSDGSGSGGSGSGGSGSEDELSDTSGNELSGCCGNSHNQKENVLQSQRSVRSVDSTGVDPLVSVFERVGRDDPQQCLPLVLCAIHADPQGLLTPQETKLVTVFRPLVIQRHVPEWLDRAAGPWVRGARQGAAAAQGKAEEANITCRKTFPNCPFSAHHLRTLMASTFGVNPQDTESKKDVHLELNVVDS